MLLNAFRRIFSKAQNRKARRSYTCPQLLQLESRIVPANFQVTSLADTATGGTLREAIDLANTTAGNDTIGFAPSLFSTGEGTITLLTAQLPQILNASTIVGAGTRGTLTITGPGATTLTISGNNGDSGRNFHILSIDTGGNLAISGVTFSGAKTTGAGGAIENAGTLTVSGSTITGNSANDGGGITNWGTLTVINTTISGNTSTIQAGGGIQNSSGSLTVINSTISGNTAATQAGGIQNNGILVVTNSTISGNTALTQSGGGIYNFTTGTLTLSGTTIAGNSANDGGGIRNLGALNISNTIIANSTSGGDYAGGGSIGTNSNNLVEDGTLPGTSEITGDPNLGPLQNNAGPTFTMALLSGSVAIGAGNATISNAAPINGKDQRGVNRTTSDIGAYSFGIQVTNTSDSNTVGSGSLRAAINLANTTAGDDQIRFNLTGLNTITLGSALPTIVSASTGVGSGTAGTVTITGLGASSLIISGSDPTNANNATRNFSIFSIASGGNLSISGVTVSGAQTSGSGGAFNNAGTLAVSGSTISGNSAISKGGGFYNQGNLFISDSVITGNAVTGWTGLMYGGGIYNGNTGSLFIANTTISSNSSATHAGGISNLGISTITNSTISNNSTVYSAGGILNNGILKLSNSTIFGNSATKTSGGGIFNNSALDIFNTTIASNSAISGGGINVNGGNLNISNTIIANSTSGGDFSGAQPVTSTNNLITIGTLTGATTVTSAQLNLGPLQNNGGPTFTMALLSGSVAIGAGNATISNNFPINGKDQRGVTRSSTAPSIGAYESLFSPQTTFATGSGTRCVTLGDVNGDGRLDIVVATLNSNNVSVLLGNGNGTFQTQANFDAGFGQYAVTLGDVNGDGKLDIVTANSGSANTSVLLGNGNGTFGAPATFATGTYPFSVILGDVNSDGKLDIITSNYFSTGVSVLLGNGNGTFQNQAVFAAGSNTRFVTLGDVNGDSKTDIVTANQGSNNASVLLGNGNGTFASQTAFATGTSPISATLGDVNGDGKLDIITANFKSDNVSVLLGNGNGTFQNQATIASGDGTISATLADVNGDGKLDIINVNSYSNTASVFLGNGNGTFQTQATFATGSNPLIVTLGDVNGDGRLDMVAANLFSPNVSVLLNTANIAPTFGTATQATLTTPAAGAPSGSAFTTQPVITIKDAAGNTVTNSTASVTMTVSSGATTLGTTTINAVAGIATFTNVGISGIAGTPYTLTFTSTGLTSATQTITPTFSSTFTVSTTANSGLGSLSAAITLANTTPGDDQISFNLSGVNMITLGSALPTIVDASTVVGSGTAGTVTITGLGASSLNINGNKGNFSIFSIASGGDLSISGVTVSGAQTSVRGGAFNNSGNLAVSNSTISDNTAGTGGGGIVNYGSLTISNSTLSRNTSNNGGGGIWNAGTLMFTNSTLSGNTAIGGNGGGIFNYNGNLAVTNSTLSGNIANNGGGGGIATYRGTLTVTNSTLSGNSANGAFGSGGGIFNNNLTTVINSTLSGNTATRGGAIANNKGYALFGTQLTGCTLTVTNSTLSGNTATATKGGGIYNFAGTSGVANSTLNVANTIIANSTSGGDYAGGGSIGTNSNNLVEDGTLPGTSEITGDPNLGPLQNNGGPTFTMALLSGSAAIGAGNATISNAAPINGKDQRGINRTTSDIGAYSFGIQVTNTSDSNTVGSGSLRAAINLANTTPGDDQIVFNLTGLNTITLGSALPTIVSASTAVTGGTAGTVTITGLGASSLIISGSDPTNANNATRNFSIFSIASGGNLSISGVTVSGAQTSGQGGAFINSGTLTVNNSNISNNKTTNTAFASGGGGIWNGGTLTVNNSIISSNISKLHGGGIWNAGTLMVNNSTISGNTANSTTGYGGGGIFNYNGNLAITNSTLSGNIANNGGGGIEVYRGTLTVTNSTISGNTADVGGGIFNNSVTTVINSTISGNSANGALGSGGGIFNNSGGAFFGNKSTGCTLTVINSTLSGNSATNGGGIYNRVRTDLYHGNSTLNIANTIIANSTNGGDYAGGGNVTLISPATSASNLVTQTGALVSAWATTVTSAQLNLGPLQNNGGPTFTMALRTGSVAIGAGNATISNAAPINKLDQRGINRTTSDIGAYSFGIQVTNTSDSNTVGSGSLRAAINLANTTPGDDQIVFNLTGLNTITLGSALPTIIDASTVVGSGTAGTVTITGLGASSLNISGNNGDVNRNFNIFSIASGGDLSISGVTISGAKTSVRGGAFNNSGNLAVSNSTISGNTAGTGGGGIFNFGTLNIANSTISGNTSNSGGGGIVNNSGTFSISNSTISGNTTSTGAGGGINNNNGGTLNIANSTISGNTASTNGGGIFSDGTLTVINSTISGNTASTGAGGGINNGGTLNIANSIIANSTNGGDYAGGGSIGTNSNNLVEDGTLPGTSEITGDPQLGPLQNNGGPTFTMALGTGSAAIGAGNATISNARPINGKDQRGYARSSTAPSIGAFEYIPATQATLTTTAVGAPSGSAFTTQPVITLKDTFGNTVNTNASVTMTVSSGATTLGMTTINAVAGIATFTDVGISGAAGTVYTLTFTSGSLTVTQNITPTFGLATQATNTISAAGSASGSAFTTQPIITIKDAFGNIVTNSTASVTMSVNGNGTTVGTTINTVNGVATFSGVGISGTAGTSYTLTFNSTGLTSAIQNITPTFGLATQATLTTNPAGAPSGSAFTTQPVITIKDAFGNTVTNNTASVTMTVSSGDNKATTLGSTTINAVAGIATFSGVGISGTDGTSYTLTFTSGSFTATQSITATFGLATQATLTTQAAGSASGSAFTTQPVITIKDAFGNIVTNSTASVTMTVSSGDNKATTVGAFTINAVAGIATFTNVGISGTAGTPYTLTFISIGLTIPTQTITPTFGLATQATLTTPASGAPSGLAFIIQPVITINDTFGNPITNSTASVTMTVSSGASTIGTTTVNAVAGIATFTNVGISGAAGNSYTLTFTSGSLATATQTITPAFGPAIQISSPSEPIPFPLGVSSTKDLVILTGINPATISGYVATIVWGDGSQNSAGTIALSPNQSGVFQVLGTHTYSSLELFNGSVSVTSVFDNRIFSSNFNVEVLTAAQKEKISDISAEVLPPGGKTADVTISGVINSFYKQSANNSSPVILFTASYVSNPQPYATAAPAQSFFDVRLRNPDPGAVLTLTANFSGGLQRGSSPYIQFAQDTSTSYQNVVSSNNLVVINYINNTITVLIDQNSFPLINNLRGTVFAVVTGATQVSSNTITVLPAAFTSGTAVGIAWGASSTLVDVATSANASNTTLTFQNSRKTTLSLAPSQSKGTVILRTVNNGGKTNEEASKETIKQLTNPDILQSIIRGTIGIGPEVIGGMIKKMLPENAGSFLKQWSKVVSEIKGVPNDMITSKVNAIPQTNNGSSTDKPEECDDTLFEDAVFDDISKISSALGLVDESIPCLNGVSLDSMLEELAFCGEINWTGLALSTLTLSQFRTFPKDNSKRVRPIKVGSM